MFRHAMRYGLPLLAAALLGWAVGAALQFAAFPEQAARAIGVSVGILTWLTAGMYASLAIREPDQATREMSAWERGRRAREVGKIVTAPLRLGFIYSVLFASSAAVLEKSNLVVAALALLGAVGGGVIGEDFRRRWFRKRASTVRRE